VTGCAASPGGAGLGIDWAVLCWTRPWGSADPIGPTWLAAAMRLLSGLGAVPTLLGLIAVATLALLARRRLGAVALLLGAAAGGVLLHQAIRWGLPRPRPPALFRTEAATGPGFPSGHAMFAAIAYPLLGLLLAEGWRDEWPRRAVMAVAWAVPVLVGLARIHLALHWVTDVVAGWTAGAIWLLLCCHLARQAGHGGGTPGRR
jgi:undecaprenyl-diphosphatase